MILLDTNILLRYARIADPAYATVDTAINALHTNGEVLCEKTGNSVTWHGAYGHLAFWLR